MSHFVVLVVVRDAKTATDAISATETLLGPFNENMSVDPYFVHCEQKEVDRAVAFYRDNPEYCVSDGDGPVKPFDEFVTDGDLEAWHEWTRAAVGGYCASGAEHGVYDATLDRFGYMSTYNPLSKWDWWAIGGRWAGYFRVKADAPQDDWRLGEPSWGNQTPPEEYKGRADVAKVGAIDFEGARELARQGAEETFDKLEAATKDVGHPVSFQSFVREEYAKAEIDPEGWEQFMPDAEVEERREKFNAPLNVARQRYHANPWVVAMREAGLLGFFGNPIEDYRLDRENPREEYVQSCVDGVFVPFSMLMDGEWHERGEMGWFGMSHNEMDTDDWDRKVARLFASLHDDVFLVAVDLHI